MYRKTSQADLSRLAGALHLRFPAATRIIVEPGMAGGYNVSPRPRQRELERNFPIAVDALDHACVLAMEIGGEIVDLAGVGASCVSKPPPLKSKAPDPAATGSSADASNLAGGCDRDSSAPPFGEAARRVVARIEGRLHLRIGGVA